MKRPKPKIIQTRRPEYTPIHLSWAGSWMKTNSTSYSWGGIFYCESGRSRLWSGSCDRSGGNSSSRCSEENQVLPPGSNTAHPSMFVAPGNVLGQSLSLGWSHKDIRGGLEKTDNTSILYFFFFFSGRFCFCQRQVDQWAWGEPCDSNQPSRADSHSWWEEAPREATTCLVQKACENIMQCGN